MKGAGRDDDACGYILRGTQGNRKIPRKLVLYPTFGGFVMDLG